MAPPGPPTVTVRDTPLSDSDAPVLATAVRAVDGQARTSDAALTLAESLGLDLPALLEHASATGAAGQVVEAPVIQPGSTVRRLLLVGAGDDSPSDARRAGAALARRATGAERVATDTADRPGRRSRPRPRRGRPARGVRHRQAVRRRGQPASAPVQAVDLHLAGRVAAPIRTAVDLAGVTARSVHLARDLANTPSNLKDPAWLAGQARDLGRTYGLEVTVRDEKQLASEGFGGIVGVGMGSARPPRLIEMSYTPPGSARRAPHVVLVGKGITFDSGGLSLKPRDSMVSMKTDMAAGGAVIAVMTALRDAGVRARVTGLVAAAENLPGASAPAPRRRHHALRRADRRGLQHRRRGPAGPGRRARVRRRRARPRPRRGHGDADRSRLAGPRAPPRGALHRRRGPRPRPARGR